MVLRLAASLGLAILLVAVMPAAGSRVRPVLDVPVATEGAEGEPTRGEPRWDQAALESVTAYAKRQRSSAVVVVVDHPVVIAERYWSVDAAAGSPHRNMLSGRTEALAPGAGHAARRQRSGDRPGTRLGLGLERC